MRWYDRLMIGALVVGCIVLAVTFARLGRNVADLDDHRSPVTITEGPSVVTPATVPPGWVVQRDGDTEVWTNTATTPPTTDDRCVNRLFLECP